MTPQPPPVPDSDPHGRTTLPGNPRPDGRRVVLVAFLLSAAIHVAAILVYPLLVGAPPPGPVNPPAAEERPPQGIRIVRIEEVPEAERAPVEAPRPALEEPPEPTPPVSERVEEGAVAPEPIEPLEAPSRSAAEELRPRKGDPRIWAPLPDDVTEVDGKWLAQLRIIWTLEELADSANAAAAAAAAARDWTYTDAEGKKWGISEGKIHLGDLTIPFPFSFGARPGTEAWQRAQEDAEILRGAIEAATRETLKERNKAIEERMRRERQNRGKTKPDTTGGGGG